MITDAPTEKDNFHHMLEGMYSQSPRNEHATKAWQRLLELGLPTRQSEVFQYIRLRTLYTQSFQNAETVDIQPSEIDRYVLPECAQAVLVFVNGHYRPNLSRLAALPKRLVLLPMSQAVKTYGSFINNQWHKLLKEDNDPFSLLNAALHGEALFIYAPPKTVLETPIQILHISACGENPMLMTPRIHGFVGAQSELNLVSTHAHLSGEKSFYTLALELSIDEESHVKYTQDSIDLGHHAWIFDAFRASVKRNSTLKTFMATLGSDSVRHDYRISLTGENAEVQLNGIWMLSNNDEAHSHVLVEHQAPNCRSMQLFKGALNDTSHSSFEGKIYVHQAAQKTEAFQLNNNLILSEKAKADSKPNLEIFADDVKASHGATVGQLDEEQLFYLKTRGFSPEEAKNVLVYGFCKQVIDLIPVASVAKNICERAKGYLKRI